MRKRVLIDTDPGVDDALALLFAFRSPEIQVDGITTVCGNVSVEQATRNVFSILRMLNPGRMPGIGMGACAFLQKDRITAEHIHGEDGLAGFGEILKPNEPLRDRDVQALHDLPTAMEIFEDLLCRPGDLTVVCLGPLTNLAQALCADLPGIKRVREVVIMGGAIRVPGNITPTAEFNIFADPQAARIVFASGLPITLVPLDVTRRVALHQRDIEACAVNRHDPAGRFFCDATIRVMENIRERGGEPVFALHDPLAVGVAVDRLLVETVAMNVDVEIQGRLTEGMTVADLRPLAEKFRAPTNLEVAVQVNAAGFIELFVERMVGRAESDRP